MRLTRAVYPFRFFVSLLIGLSGHLENRLFGVFSMCLNHGDRGAILVLSIYLGRSYMTTFSMMYIGDIHPDNRKFDGQGRLLPQKGH